MFTFPFSFFNVSILSGVNLTYVSNGDTNGLVYYLGTNGLTSSFSNPNNLIATASSTSGGNVNNIKDRLDNTWFTSNTSNQWVKFSLVDYQIKLNRYNIKTRSDANTNHLRSWKLQGSNDNNIWTDLDIRTNDTTLNSANTWYTFPITTNDYYRHIRILNTGLDSGSGNYITMNEFELYGEIINYTGTSVSIPFDVLGGNDIIYYLGTNGLTSTFSNPNNNSILSTSSGFGSGTSNLLTDRANSNFWTNDSPNSNVIFDFILNKVKPTSYVLQGRISTDHYLRSWKLQGSNNGTTWTDLDTRTNDTSINSSSARVMFTCTSLENYRYIRILNTGLTSSNSNFLCLGEFYIYGNISQ